MLVSLTERTRWRRWSTWLAVPSVGGALVLTAGWLIAGRVQDRYNHRSDYISSLAAVDAANPWIMIGALVFFGIGVMSLGAGLLYSLRDTLGRVGSAGVLLSGVGVVLIGSMRHDCGLQFPACSIKVSMGEVSSYHAMHDVASAATFILAGVSQLLISRSVQHNSGWRYLRLLSFASGTVTLMLFVLMTSELLPGWVGAIQRVIVGVACIWVSTFSFSLRRLAPASDHEGSRIRNVTQPS